MPRSRSIAVLCEANLRRNWREGRRAGDGTEFAYTSPSPGHYPWQWYWDSCFTAIVWRRFDPARARRELESLLAAQRDDGFIGHTIFWNTPLNGYRRFTYNVTAADTTMTASIQPPILAWAWSIVAGDPAADARIRAHHDWLDAHRDLEGDGLLWIVQPDESGLDASPQFDPIWRGEAHGRLRFLRLVRRNQRHGYDLRQIAACGAPVCAEVATNVIANLSRLALGRRSLTGTIVARMYNHRTGLFHPLQRKNGVTTRSDGPVTWAALAPLALPDLPDAIGHRLVREHLLDPKRFWLPTGVPSVSASDPTFSEHDRQGITVRYWRGPTWVNSAWMLWMGLLRLGYASEAQRLADRISATVAANGLREYYHAYSGRGMGAHDFGWSTLAVELAEPDPIAGNSYLPAGAPAQLRS
jgi:hypothetical protein